MLLILGYIKYIRSHVSAYGNLDGQIELSKDNFDFIPKLALMV